MSDWPPKIEDLEPDDEMDLGEPVTDKLVVLLDELPTDDAGDESGLDLGEPVTDKLSMLLDQLPEDWDKDATEADIADLVTDKLGALLGDTAATQETSEPEPQQQPQPLLNTEIPEAQGGGGLLGRLRRLFGRR